MLKTRYSLSLLTVASLAWAWMVALATSTQAVDFQRDVLPLLSDRCFHCHGPDEHGRQAGLRLDVREEAVDYGAIIPGDVDGSEFVARIFMEGDGVMPPPEAKNQLSDAEKDILKEWIADGAIYEKHWAFVAPTKAAPPEVTTPSWPANPIDHFVLARLDAEGLNPSSQADRHTLIRRLYFDLTGLPPSAEAVKQFVADSSPDAYEKLVDQLLASPHFGERMAIDWLDAVRYADTNGYSIDGGRHMWLWRDWVINAFNQNMPYDQFLVEQLAGDLLPNPTSAQLIATGMQRNNMVTHEGGTIPAENLTNYNADRVKTLGEAVLGLTLGCAQCHDHKFDPITQREYYQMFAYFNTISDRGKDGDGGVNPRPYFKAKTVLKTGEEAEIRETIKQLEQRLSQPNSGELAKWEDTQRVALESRGKGFKLHPTQALRISTPNSGSGFSVEQQRFIRIKSAPNFAAYDVLLRLPDIQEPITGIRVRFLPDDRIKGGLGHGRLSKKSPAGTFVLTTLSVSADEAPADQVNLHHLIPARHVTASSWHSKYRPENVLDSRYTNGWSPILIDGTPEHITYTFDHPISAQHAPFMTVQLNFGKKGRLVGARMEVDVLTGTDDGSDLPPDVIAVIDTPLPHRTAEQQALLSQYFTNHAPATRASRIALENAQERLKVLTTEYTTMIMTEAKKPRATHILNRGDYSQPGEVVTPGTPDILPPLPPDAEQNRLGLAQWLVDSQNPLTSRVISNRVWKQLFGTGLVRTAADFGLQGSYPSHPELLDWLSVELVESGWNVKHLVRTIVTSSAYRQTAVASNDLLANDPMNELLARGPRFRLPAEFIRDAALQTSGLLVDRLGGPSVNPYAPGDLWREVSHYGSTPATAQAFVQDHGEKLYRRSLYTYWKRTVPPPNMAAFDAPSREVCVVDRPTTNTPLQALVMLNDVQFVEAARAFAERIASHSGSDIERLRWAALEMLSRPLSQGEIDVLLITLARERKRYAADNSAAAKLLAVGESPRDTSIPPEEHAAWTQVATLLLNLSEAITRN